jgi:hypothetical protein
MDKIAHFCDAQFRVTVTGRLWISFNASVRHSNYLIGDGPLSRTSPVHLSSPLSSAVFTFPGMYMHSGFRWLTPRRTCAPQ